MTASNDLRDESTSQLDEHARLVPTKPARTPLPRGQLAILCLTRLAEPIAYTQIFPYVNQMMADLHVTDDPSQIGFYSGLVDSIFALAQLPTIYRWGKFSDRIGRKPVLLMGLTGVALSSFCFGLSNSLITALIARSLAGALSGNSAIIQSMIGELTDETNVGQAAPLTGICWSLGCIIGPLIGGTFSHPATRYPDLFGDFAFLHGHPYFLPSFISTTITLISAFLGYIFVEETLPSIVAAKKLEKAALAAQPVTYGSTTKDLPIRSTSSPATPANELSAWDILTHPTARSVFLSGFMLSGFAIGFDIVFTLFSYTTIDLGGIGRDPAQIGQALSSAGLLSMTLQLFAFPVLQRRIRSVHLYMALMAMWPLAYGALPFINLVARMGKQADGTLSPAAESGVWVGIAIAMAFGKVACMAFALNVLLVKNAAPNKQALGSMYGLSQTCSSIARSISPAFVSSLFAWSAEHELLGGNLVWVIMFALGAVGVFAAMNVIDGSEIQKEQEQN
ncbi:hypothetical protein BOTBODRAFT_55194 [Botryobasidium botryosum FD-172 SS1]|uniref:Major facilitator superfamily (MFS) profile domain-containing protein n=1 Tax=Botryobasidium botryosum (strain FD-172 SS1) TaxID=930990 RepID=A0A067MGL3_BOTB1|nr:hypothetical protein BOTBODRAFT_55194 [Botryobasidium botryosum FD-172 SS1]